MNDKVFLLFVFLVSSVLITTLRYANISKVFHLKSYLKFLLIRIFILGALVSVASSRQFYDYSESMTIAIIGLLVIYLSLEVFCITKVDLLFMKLKSINKLFLIQSIYILLLPVVSLSICASYLKSDTVHMMVSSDNTRYADNYSDQVFQSIQVGMTKSEVLSKLGEPLKLDERKGIQYLRYTQPKEGISPYHVKVIKIRDGIVIDIVEKYLR